MEYLLRRDKQKLREIFVTGWPTKTSVNRERALYIKIQVRKSKTTSLLTIMLLLIVNKLVVFDFLTCIFMLHTHRGCLNSR